MKAYFDHKTNRLRNLGFSSYSEYLKSEWWANFKKYFFRCPRIQKAKVDGYLACEFCSVTNVKLLVHHKTYERIGRERFSDVVLLCDVCHGACHRLQNLRGDKCIYNATNIVGGRIKAGQAAVNANDKRKATAIKNKKKRRQKRKTIVPRVLRGFRRVP